MLSMQEVAQQQRALILMSRCAHVYMCVRLSVRVCAYVCSVHIHIHLEIYCQQNIIYCLREV